MNKKQSPSTLNQVEAAKFASVERIRVLQAEVDELILAIATYMVEPGEDIAAWASYVFVSDESRIGDFLASETEATSLAERLSLLPLQQKDFICEAAEMIRQRNRPN